LDNAGSYTFNAVDLGLPGATRTLVVAVHAATNVPVTFGGLSVNNTPATAVAVVGENAGPGGPTALYVVPLAEGTSGTVEVTFSAGVVRCAIAVVAAYGLASITPADTGTLDQLAPGNVMLSVPNGGAVVGALTMAGDATASATWTLAPETYDQLLQEGTPTLVSGVLATGLGGMTNVGVQTVGAGFNTRVVMASFR